MRQHFITLFTVFVVSVFNCAGTAAQVEREAVISWMRAKIIIPAAPAETADRAIDEVFKAIEEMQPRFDPALDGELRRVNERIAAAALPMALSAPMTDVLRQAREYSVHGLNLFNPAIGNLIALWGFGGEIEPTAPPAAADIERLLSPPPLMRDVRIDGNRLLSAPSHVLINLGAMTEGVALDVAKEILHRHGIRHALIDVGGSMMALGKNGDQHWQVALRGSRNSPPLATVALKDGEVMYASGGSGKSFEYEGRQYHHILDPRTGNSAKNQWTAIVINDHPTNAGAIAAAAATALVIANEAETAQIIKNFNLTLAWQHGRDGEDRVTEALRKRVDGS